MRTIMIFKHLDPAIDGIPGKLFQHELRVPHRVKPHVDQRIPSELLDVITPLVYMHPGRVFEAQEQHETIGIFTADKR